MNLNCSTHDGTTIVTVTDPRIDAGAAIRFKDAMRTATAGGGDVILDLGHVDFIDSSGLGAIVAVKKLLGKDRNLDLAGLTPNVDKVFRLTRMDTIFGIHSSVDSALRKAG